MRDPKIIPVEPQDEDESFVEEDEVFQRGLDNANEDLNHLPEVE